MEVHASTAASRAPGVQCGQEKDIEAIGSEKAPSVYKDSVAVDTAATTSADLDRIASRRTQRSTARSIVIDPEAEPPDGGMHAWLKVFGCFLMYANTL
jgi:hypothetical protein